MAWLVAHTRCRRCGHEGVSVHERGTPEHRLECAACGAQDSLARRVRCTDPNAAKRVGADDGD